MKNIKRIITLNILFTSLLFGAVPNINNAIRLIEPPKEVQKKPKDLIEIDAIKKKYKPQLQDDKSGVKILIKNFKIENNRSIPTEHLMNLLSSYKNKELSFNDMQTIASIITKEYRNQGYFVSRAYLPVQKMSNGILTVSVIEGDYGEFVLVNNSKVKDSLIQDTLNYKKKNIAINSQSLEKSLLIVNDFPGITVLSADIKPGKSTGSSDLIVTVENTDQSYDGYVLIDNYGSRYIGQRRMMTGLNLLSPFKIGDELSFTGLLSNGEDLKNGMVLYSFPLYKNGLRTKISYSKTSYHLVEEYHSLNSIGTSDAIDVRFTYPIIKKRAKILDVFLNIRNKYLKDEVRSTDYEIKKDLLAYDLGLTYNRDNSSLFGLNHSKQASIVVTYGDLNFKDDEQKEEDKTGANTQGNYSKVKINLTSNLHLLKNLLLTTSFQYQHTLGNKNLDGSEDFSVGGVYGVKVYPDGELSAENGYLLSIEAKYQLLPSYNDVSQSIGIFYDRGKAYMSNQLSTFENRTLQDVGLGYYANYKDFFVKVQAAWKIDNEHIDSEADYNSKLLIMAGWSF